MSGGSPIAPGALCLEPCWVKKRKKETGQNYYLSTAVLWHGQVGANGIKKNMDKTWMFYCYLWHCMQSRDDIVTRNELDGVINAISGRKKSDLQPEEIQGSPNLMLLNVSAEIEIKVKRNMKSCRNKFNPMFPRIWWSETATLQLWGRFQTLCDEPKWFFLDPQPFQCIWEGSSVISYRFGAKQVTQFSLYFFRITSQGVAALVSVSDGKIKIYN